jgi:hypothetical protein
MNSTRIDDLIAALSATVSRRAAVRAIGATTAIALAAIAGRDGVAKTNKNKKKKRKKRTASPGVCPSGTLVGTVAVPANGTSVTTVPLNQGQRYRLRATGFWSTNAEFGNDAYAAFKLTAPGTPTTVFQGTRLGLSVAGGSPDLWGSYNSNHVYEREVTGQGAALSLRFTDPVTSDNAGTLTVDVICV